MPMANQQDMSQPRDKSAFSDNSTARFLLAIIKQKNLKDIDWTEVAADPILRTNITNGHAARMRYSRLRALIDPKEFDRRNPVDVANSKVKKSKGTKALKKEKKQQSAAMFSPDTIRKEVQAQLGMPLVQSTSVKREQTQMSPQYYDSPVSLVDASTSQSTTGLSTPRSENLIVSATAAAAATAVTVCPTSNPAMVCGHNQGSDQFHNAGIHAANHIYDHEAVEHAIDYSHAFDFGSGLNLNLDLDLDWNTELDPNSNVKLDEESLAMLKLAFATPTDSSNNSAVLNSNQGGYDTYNSSLVQQQQQPLISPISSNQVQYPVSFPGNNAWAQPSNFQAQNATFAGYSGGHFYCDPAASVYPNQSGLSDDDLALLMACTNQPAPIVKRES